MQDRPTLAIIGGTGALGSGLAMRWAAAGYPVVLGSRSREKAEAAAREIEPGNGAPPVRGDSNEGAACAGNIVVIALADAIGTRGIDGGALANLLAGEALTSVLIGINRRYKVDCAGIRITGTLGSSLTAQAWRKV